MKRINVSFPVEMSFNPNPRMPVCPDSDVGPPPVFLSAPPDTIISRCPDSVLGNGTAVLYVGRGNNENAKLLDPVLVIFNGGRKPDGTPRIKVYGYSERLNTGIYLEGALDRNVLGVDIGQLPGDSAVGLFDLNIPGEASPFTNRRGRDPAFVRTTCADGSWEASAAFTLGTRDTGGNPTSPDSIVQAPPVTVPCQGAAGVTRLAVARVKQSGRRLKVTLRNTGTASASGFRIRLARSGRGRSWRVPVIRPGDSLDVYVPRQAKGGASGVVLVPPRSGPR
jgi:hypothetical protein